MGDVYNEYNALAVKRAAVIDRKRLRAIKRWPSELNSTPLPKSL
jgi:hypothetical protein